MFPDFSSLIATLALFLLLDRSNDSLYSKGLHETDRQKSLFSPSTLASRSSSRLPTCCALNLTVP